MISEWVNCPICNEPDMRKETEDGDSLIFCVNLNCRSNGGNFEYWPNNNEALQFELKSTREINLAVIQRLQAEIDKLKSEMFEDAKYAAFLSNNLYPNGSERRGT